MVTPLSTSSRRKVALPMNPIIPGWFDDLGLTASQFRVLCHLWRRAGKQAGKDGKCYPGYVDISKTCRLNKDTVAKALNQLETLGLITRTHGRNYRNEFELCEWDEIADSALRNKGPAEAISEAEQPSESGPDPSEKTGRLPIRNQGSASHLKTGDKKDCQEGEPLKENQEKGYINLTVDGSLDDAPVPDLSLTEFDVPFEDLPLCSPPSPATHPHREGTPGPVCEVPRGIDPQGGQQAPQGMATAGQGHLPPGGSPGDAERADFSSEPADWLQWLPKVFPDQGQARSAASCTWDSLPAHWRARILRVMTAKPVVIEAE